MSQVKEIFGQKFSRDSLINIIGTIVNSLLGLGFFVIVARNLGPVNFGLFSVFAAISVLLADIFDLGTNQGLIKFVSENLAAKNLSKVYQFLKLGLEIKLMLGFFLTLAGLIIALLSLQIFFQNWALLLFLSFFGVLPALILGFVFHSLQGFSKFLQANLSQIFANLARLVFVVIFLLGGNISVLTSLLIFVLSPLLGAAFGLFFLPGKFFKILGEFGMLKEFLRFNIWMTFYFVLFSIYWRANTFMLAGISGAAQTGIYNVAAQLVLPFLQISGNLQLALAPHFTSFEKISQAKNFFWKTLKFSLFLVLPIAVLIIFLPYVIPFLFGQSYSQSVWPLQILTLGSALLIVSVPATTFIIYFLSKPKIYTLITLIQVFVILALGFFLISNFGAVGAALAFLVSQIWLFFASLIFSLTRKE